MSEKGQPNQDYISAITTTLLDELYILTFPTSHDLTWYSMTKKVKCSSEKTKSKLLLKGVLLDLIPQQSRIQERQEAQPYVREGTAQLGELHPHISHFVRFDLVQYDHKSKVLFGKDKISSEGTRLIILRSMFGMPLLWLTHL